MAKQVRKARVVNGKFTEFTPEEREEWRKKRLERIKSLTAEYQLGLFVGEYIVDRFLPTVSTDMIKSKHVIQVSEEDTARHTAIHKALHDRFGYNSIDDESQEWKDWLAINRELEAKYLPHKLECYVRILNIIDEKEFKTGIMHSLWDCDMCCYKCGIDEIEISQDDNLFFTNINLYLDHV